MLFATKFSSLARHTHGIIEEKNFIISYLNFLFFCGAKTSSEMTNRTSRANLGTAARQWCFEIRSVSLTLTCVRAERARICAYTCGRIHRSIERYISLTTLPPVASRLLTRPKYQPARMTMFRDTWSSPRPIPLFAFETFPAPSWPRVYRFRVFTSDKTASVDPCTTQRLTRVAKFSQVWFSIRRRI